MALQLISRASQDLHTELAQTEMTFDRCLEKMGDLIIDDEKEIAALKNRVSQLELRNRALKSAQSDEWQGILQSAEQQTADFQKEIQKMKEEFFLKIGPEINSLKESILNENTLLNDLNEKTNYTEVKYRVIEGVVKRVTKLYMNQLQDLNMFIDAVQNNHENYLKCLSDNFSKEYALWYDAFATAKRVSVSIANNRIPDRMLRNGKWIKVKKR